MGKIVNFNSQMYNLLYDKGITKTVLFSIPESLEKSEGSFVVVELPYSLKPIDISNYGVYDSYVKFTIFAKDLIRNTASMADFKKLERISDSIEDLLPFKGDGFTIMKSRTIVTPKSTKLHYSYMVVTAPVLFK